MKRLLSVLIKQLRKAFKAVYVFFDKHGLFNAIVENMVKLVFIIIVFYIFGTVVW